MFDVPTLGQVSTPPVPGVDFLDSTPIVLVPTGKQANISIEVRNNDSEVRSLYFGILLKDRRGMEVPAGILSGSRSSIAGNTIALCQVQFSAANDFPPISGFLTMQIEENTAPSKPRTLRVRPLHLLNAEAERYANCLMSALVVTLVLVCICTLTAYGMTTKRWPKMRDKMGMPSWEVSKSWASNLSTLGGLLGVLIGAAILPDYPTILRKQTYSALNVLFFSFSVIAPFVYVAFRTQTGRTVPPDGLPEYNGYVGMYILAGGLAVAAAVAQLLTLVVLLNDLDNLGVLTKLGAVGAQGVVITVMIAITIYGVRSMHETLKWQHTAGEATVKPADASPATQKVTWSIL
jgi:hypothetical protein